MQPLLLPAIGAAPSSGISVSGEKIATEKAIQKRLK